MRTATAILISTGLFSVLRASAAADTTFHSGPAQVTLVELYTSEGCSSCPPAEQWLGDLRHDAGLWQKFVPVALHVNYWDHLGWRDVLASAANTERQYALASAWGTSSVYTPCFVRNGQEWRPRNGGAAELSADSSPKASATGEGPAKADAGKLTVVWQTDGTCRIDFIPPSRARRDATRYGVAVALLGSGIDSKVRAGENRGRNLHH